jgi:hypothetical protein
VTDVIFYPPVMTEEEHQTPPELNDTADYAKSELLPSKLISSSVLT